MLGEVNMVELPIAVYIIVGIIAVALIVWGFVSNSKNKKNRDNIDNVNGYNNNIE